jgi:hypothetical protein
VGIDPALTYRGALSILGKHEHPTLKKLDQIFGGFILVSPIGPVNALNLVDPKNEASTLVRGLLDRAVDRLLGTAGFDRIELISAAHSVIVISSFFDALRQCIGTQAYSRLKLSKSEKTMLATKEPAGQRKAALLLETLTMTSIPIPSATVGWRENLDRHLTRHWTTTAERTLEFISGLEAWRPRRDGLGSLSALARDIADAAARNYVDAYQRLTSDVPEFAAWSTLNEHAATRADVRQAHAAVQSALDGHANALQKLQAALAAATSRSPQRPQRQKLADVNGATMTKPIVAAGTMRHVEDVCFPTVQDGYVTPAFRLAQASQHARPAHEKWWDTQPLRDDLDDFLFSYLGSAASYRSPLVVLGHPGSGKSLLTKVLAARLPASGFATVRVPLRSVTAGADLYRQIDEVLDHETHGRVRWTTLAEESRDVTRVVLLDGLDELIQATGVTQSNYLYQVAQFQQRELDMRAPVAVVVTSRTVVADRADLPHECTMVKLEDFDRARIGQWLDIWRTANLAKAHEGTFRALTLDSALRHADLARQPLLLLMLALYTADPSEPDPGAKVLSVANLYQRLLDNFIRRELRKSEADGLAQATDSAANNQRWHLGMAAFGMFNRGRQQISEKELDNDIEAIESRTSSTAAHLNTMELPITQAQHTIGKFFFVHAAEADGNRQGGPRRTYEFLHATFGEYLIAATTINLLLDAARQRRSAHLAPYRGEAEEPLIPPLLSHHPLLKRRSIITFVQELTTLMPPDDATAVRDVLEELSKEARRVGQAVRFGRYNPSGADLLGRLAAYTVNLSTLRTAMTADVPLARLAPPGTDVMAWWQSAVRLWHAGLDEDGWEVTLQHFRTGIGPLVSAGSESLRLGTAADIGTIMIQTLESEVMSTPGRSLQLRLGSVIHRNVPAGAKGRLAGLEYLLDVTLSAPDARHLSLYNEIVSTLYDIPDAFNSTLLACLARDCERLPVSTTIAILSKILNRSWSETPNLPHIARILMAFPHVLSGDHLPSLSRLSHFGTHQDWVRLFTAALLERPGPWPNDQDALFEIIGETSAQAISYADLIPFPPPSGHRHPDGGY